MSRKAWPKAVKAKALRIAAESTSEAASEATGVPAATIRSWLKRETDRAQRALAVAGIVHAPDLADLPWKQRREILTMDLGKAASEALAATRAAVAQGDLREAKDGAVAFGILTDKALLLSGEPTARTDRRSVNVSMDLSNAGSAIDREIAELTERLGLGPDGDPDEEAFLGMLGPDDVIDVEVVDP